MTSVAPAVVAAPARPFVIREARRDEYERVGEVTFLGFGHGEPGASRPDPRREALLRDAAARAEGGDLLVAVVEQTGEILGTASLLRADSALVRQSRDGEAELRLLAVLPEARRAGAGRALMAEAVERARRWGAPALVLDTGPWNLRSQRLYHRLGFERIPERETQPASRGGFLAVFRLDYLAREGVLVRLAGPPDRLDPVLADIVLAPAAHADAVLADAALPPAARGGAYETWLAVDRGSGEVLGAASTRAPADPRERGADLVLGPLAIRDDRASAIERAAVERALLDHAGLLARVRGAGRVSRIAPR